MKGEMVKDQYSRFIETTIFAYPSIMSKRDLLQNMNSVEVIDECLDNIKICIYNKVEV